MAAAGGHPVAVDAAILDPVDRFADPERADDARVGEHRPQLGGSAAAAGSAASASAAAAIGMVSRIRPSPRCPAAPSHATRAALAAGS